jgi:methylase of polypeptide subunit release factors
VLPHLSAERCERLREAFLAAGYTADGVIDLLGAQAHAALGRGEPEPARRVSLAGDALGTLIRLFLLGAAEPEREVAAALAPLPLSEAVAAGLVVRAAAGLRAGLDIRPYGDELGSWWVVSDLEPVIARRSALADHVLGVGHASLSLVRATARRPVRSLLDVGTGCGVQALHAARHAERITASDVSERALALAEATFRLNLLDVELLRGPWFEPVTGRQFDQIVCNPPFVVGPPRVDYVYRDSGLAGDDASALVVRELPNHLAAGGVGQLLASWLHVRGQDWAERVAGWIPSGVDAWFVQRDVADPALYVGTWLRDAGIDPRSAEGAAKAGAWLDWFAEQGVDGVGFGFVTLRRTDGPADVVCEDLRQAFDDPLGVESVGWLDRVDWLRANGSDRVLLSSRFTIAPRVVLEEVSSPSADGWSSVVRRLHRTDGPRWQHEVDDMAAALLTGCRGALELSDLIGLLAAAHGVAADALAASALPAIRDLIRHGMLLPAEWDDKREAGR